MPLRIRPLRPWIALGDHVYLPCAEPDGQCIKLNPHASRVWSGWLDAGGVVDEPTPDDRRLADALCALGVATATSMASAATSDSPADAEPADRETAS